jgi:hypothetical protein
VQVPFLFTNVLPIYGVPHLPARQPRQCALFVAVMGYAIVRTG